MHMGVSCICQVFTYTDLLSCYDFSDLLGVERLMLHKGFRELDGLVSGE
jgi:hypothetical protein